MFTCSGTPAQLVCWPSDVFLVWQMNRAPVIGFLHATADSHPLIIAHVSKRGLRQPRDVLNIYPAPWQPRLPPLTTLRLFPTTDVIYHPLQPHLLLCHGFNSGPEPRIRLGNLVHLERITWLRSWQVPQPQVFEFVCSLHIMRHQPLSSIDQSMNQTQRVMVYMACACWGGAGSHESFIAVRNMFTEKQDTTAEKDIGKPSSDWCTR